MLDSETACQQPICRFPALGSGPIDLMQFGVAGECLMDAKPAQDQAPCLFEQALRATGALQRHPQGGVHSAPDGVSGDLKTSKVSCTPLPCQERNGLPPNG